MQPPRAWQPKRGSADTPSRPRRSAPDRAAWSAPADCGSRWLGWRHPRQGAGMAESEQSQRKTRRTEDREIDEVTPTDPSHKAELDSEVDSLLDEIDDVLEVNAEEFVRSVVQPGGQ